MIEHMPEPKKFKVGPVESDSGNHLVDIFSVVIVICLLCLAKKISGL
jgi:hypothetical protein